VPYVFRRIRVTLGELREDSGTGVVIALPTPYLVSESTFYRMLKAHNPLDHRGAERPAQVRHKPRALVANAPGQLFSWDITYRTPSQRSLPARG
jgi:hypothetical protein